MENNRETFKNLTEYSPVDTVINFTKIYFYLMIKSNAFIINFYDYRNNSAKSTLFT